MGFIGRRMLQAQGSFPLSATGGTESLLLSTDSLSSVFYEYKLHTFTPGNYTFKVGRQGKVEYLLVAGGGAGGNSTSLSWGGGGGGAGGVLTNLGSSLLALSAGNYPITVGAGGARGTNQYGSNTTAFSYTAIGGGVGGMGGGGGSGGSGGGGTAGAGNPGGIGVPGQGNTGGSSNHTNTGAGGGGYSAVGGNTVSTVKAGNGGNGIFTTIRSLAGEWMAGGGGGGTSSTITSNRGSAGQGSNGLGGVYNVAGVDGGIIGSGGGGSGATSSARIGGAGGPGIAIVRYLNKRYRVNIPTVTGTYTQSTQYLNNKWYLIYTFTGNGTITPSGSTNIEYFAVAGGGAGGGSLGNSSISSGGGGGAGGVVFGTSTLNPSTTYSVIVGAGGNGQNGSPGFSGQNSSIVGLLTAIGGGGGASGSGGNGQNGGSGGGGGPLWAATTAGAGVSGQGQAGGGSFINSSGGGGGGYSSKGGSAYSGSGGNGGLGILSDITGVSTWYAAGGGGASDASNPIGLGGSGIGGNGGYASAGSNGAVNTGSGGGGGNGLSLNYRGGNGGSGIVVVRVPFSSADTSYFYSDPYFNNVSLLAHMDDSQGSTIVADSSNNKLTLARSGNTSINTTYKKFGTGSVFFDGSQDYLSTTSSDLFNFGTGDFTIEFWYLKNGIPNSFGRIFQTAQGDTYTGISICFDSITDDLRCDISYTGAGWSLSLNNIGTVSSTAWRHFAVVRRGSTIICFQDGVRTTSGLIGSNSLYYSNTGTSSQIVVGGTGPYTPSRSVNGYIDDLRVTKGIARYISDFTPPNAPFPDSEK